MDSSNNSSPQSQSRSPPPAKNSSPSASISRSPNAVPAVVPIALDIPPLPPSSIHIALPQSTSITPHRAGLDPGGVLSDFEEVVLVSNPASTSNQTSPADHRITITTTDTTTDSTSLSYQDRASSSGSVSSLSSAESSSIDPHIAPQYPIVSHPWSIANRPTPAGITTNTVAQLPPLQHPQPRRNGFPSTNSPVVSPQLRPSGPNWFSSLLGDEARSGSGLSTPNSLQRPTSAASFAALGRRQVLGVIEQRNELGPKLAIFMVGLPARGKSYICKKLTRYLSWCGYNTKVFNVGNKRRTSASTPHPPTAPTLSLPAEPPAPARTPSTSHNASFFDPQNAEARALRDQMAMEVVDEMLEWLNNKQGKVAVHDATNSNIERRRALVERVKREKNVRAIFIESVCTDPAILEQNIRMKTKGPDYAHMPEEDAIRDFKARMVNYEKAYEGLGAWEENEDISYIKIYNVGKKVVAYNIKGFLQSQCVFYLMQIHIRPRMIWLTRHGESVYNVNNRIGGDPPLTENGRKYGAALLKFVQKFHPPPVEPSPISSNPALDEMVQSPVTSSSTEDEDDVLTIAAKEQDAVVPSGSMNLAMYPRKTLGRIGLQTTSGETSRRRGSLDVLETMEEGRNLSIWTSTLRRTVETVAEVDAEACEVKHVRALNEIHAGFCENLTYKEIERNYPQEFASRRENKLTYRYPGPGGESYIDVIERLRPVIIELERMDTNVLIVTHNVVMRTLLTYFLGIPLEEMPNKQIPLHTVYCLQPKPYGADLVKYQYDADTDDFVDVGSSV